MWCIKAFFLVSTLLLFSSFIQKEPKSKVTKYTTRNGFPLKVINSITQDKEGLMWFAAEDGLARFDGYSFQLFKNDPDNPYSLSNNYVHWIFTDSEGIVWTSSRKGINRFDPKTEQFIHYRHHPKDDNSLVGDNISHIAESTTGNLWISSWGEGFTYFDKKKARFIPYSQRNLPGLSSQKVLCVYEDPEGLLWVGSQEGGLDVFRTKDGKVTQKVERLSRKNILPLLSVRCIIPDHLGNVWIGTFEGLVFYHRKQNTFQVLNTDNSALKGNSIRSLREDSKQNLWIGVEDKGLHQLSLKNLDGMPLTKLSVEPVEGEDEDEYSVYKHSIHSIYEDRDHNIWLATNSDGVEMMSGIPEKFTRIQRKQTSENEGAYLRFWGMCSDEEGHLWLGSDGDGIYQYKSNGELLRHYTADGKKGSLTDNAILCAFRDHSNTLWFGTYSQGLFRYDKKTDAFINYQHDPTNPQSLGHNDVRVIFEDSKHNLWVGTNWGGLNLLNKSTGTFTIYDTKNSNISSGDVRAIVEDKQGGLWIGCSEGGLNYFDPKKKSFQQYFNDLESRHNLISNTIFALHLDGQGKLWIGAEGAGLTVYDPAKQTFQLFNERKGLNGSNVYAIQEDPTGNIWMSTNTGISKWNRSEQKFYNYDGSDGLQHGQFNSCSFLYDQTSGLMGFAGTEGVTVFYPEKVKQNPQPPNVLLTGFQLFNQPVAINPSDQAEAILKQAISQTKEITLKYDQSVFSFEFAALNYILPEKNQYAYQMEGFDKKWNYVGTKRTATYTNLDAGDYVFKVKASNNDGVWNEKGTSLLIHILPPWWETWWAKTFAVVLLASIAITFYTIRVRRLRGQNVTLEKLVTQRTKQLQLANDELLVRGEEIISQNDELVSQREELVVQNEALQESKKQQLDLYTQNIVEKFEIINQISAELELLKNKASTENGQIEKFSKILQANILTDEDWEHFKQRFNDVYPNFFASLRYRFPDITASELRLSALIKLNLSLKEAAGTLGISAESVKKSRYRLKKKFALLEEGSLEEFIRKLN